MSNQLKIIVDKEKYIVIYPDYLRSMETDTKVNEYNEIAHNWARMEALLYSLLQSYWPNSHTGMRILTYYQPQRLVSQFHRCRSQVVDTGNKKTHLLFIEDCNELDIWELFFETATNWDGGKTIFTLESQPINWTSTADLIHDLVKRLIKGDVIESVQNELPECRLLCYSVDADLIIAKADLPRNIVLDKLSVIAANHGYELDVQIMDR